MERKEEAEDACSNCATWGQFNGFLLAYVAFIVFGIMPPAWHLWHGTTSLFAVSILVIVMYSFVCLFGGALLSQWLRAMDLYAPLLWVCGILAAFVIAFDVTLAEHAHSSGAPTLSNLNAGAAVVGGSAVFISSLLAWCCFVRSCACCRSCTCCRHRHHRPQPRRVAAV